MKSIHGSQGMLLQQLHGALNNPGRKLENRGIMNVICKLLFYLIVLIFC